MKKMLFSTVFAFSLLSLTAKADVFDSFKTGDFNQALADIQALENIDETDQDGWTALMYAARLGKTDLAKILIEKGAHLEAKNHAGLTPYLWAAYAGHVEMMKLLNQSGADIDAENAYHENALDIASSMAELEAVRYILNATTDENKRQKMAQNAIYLTQDPEIKALLIQAGAIAVDIPTSQKEEDIAIESTPSSLPVENENPSETELGSLNNAPLHMMENEDATKAAQKGNISLNIPSNATEEFNEKSSQPTDSATETAEPSANDSANSTADATETAEPSADDSASSTADATETAEPNASDSASPTADATETAEPSANDSANSTDSATETAKLKKTQAEIERQEAERRRSLYSYH